MRSAFTIVIAVSVIAWGFGLLLWAGAARSESPPILGESEAEPFPHRNHVSDRWFAAESETDRDCKGCHDFVGKKDPEASCTKCHRTQDGRSLVNLEPGRLASRRRTDTAFDHVDHGNVECRACHAKPGVARVDNEMWVPSGTAICLKCHDADDVKPLHQKSTKTKADDAFTVARESALTPAKLTTFQAGINRSLKPLASTPFEHLDHMREAHTGKFEEANCTSCHSDLKTSGPDFAEHAFTDSDCGACHWQGSDLKATIVSAARDMKSASKGTFFHSDHMNVPVHADLEKGCLECHSFGMERAGIKTFGTEKGLDKYDGCVTCHYHKEKHTWTAPADGPVHGQMNRCDACHVLSRPVDMKTVRPTVTAKRSRPKEFEIKAYVHPHIAGEVTDVTSDCKKCHVAKVPAVPSRIVKARFKHESHLDPSLSGEKRTEQCVRCHEVERTTGMMQTLSTDATRQFPYKPESCQECHNSVDPIAPTGFHEVAERQVIKFPHERHLRTSGSQGPELQNCDDCHVLDTKKAPAGNEFAYGENVENCMKCHQHEGQHVVRTGGAGRKYVNTCVDCHRDPAARNTRNILFPARGQDVAIRRKTFSAIQESQYHPLPSQKKCSACHTATPTVAQAAPLNLVFSTLPGKVHDSGIGKDKDRCLECHWREVGVAKFTKREFHGGVEEETLKNWEEAHRRYGNDPFGYQGGTK